MRSTGFGFPIGIDSPDTIFLMLRKRISMVGADASLQTKHNNPKVVDCGRMGRLRRTGAPYGDNIVDYKWNTRGMTDAANRLGKSTPAAYMQAKAEKALKLLNEEARSQKF